MSDEPVRRGEGSVGALDDKVAIITGGASGIGAASVAAFVAEGASIVIADVDEAKGRALAAHSGRAGRFLRTDVTAEADVAAVVAFACEEFGGLDCIFNNAGVAGVRGPIAETPAEAFDATFAVLVRGVFLGIKHAVPALRLRGGGSIVNTASIGGLQTGYAPHAYSAAKAAVIHLTRSVAMELGELGIRANCICPGAIPTAIYPSALGLSGDAADAVVDVLRDAFREAQPIRRAGEPEDIARAAVWLASDASSFVNGHALVVDGGLSNGRGWSEMQDRVAQYAAAMSSPAQDG